MFKYFDQSVSKSWQEENFTSEAEYIEMLKLLESNKPPSRGDHYTYSDEITTFSVNPSRKSVGYKAYLKSGEPVFNIVHGHEMDSEWAYPVIETIEVNMIAESERVSQADYVDAHPTLHKRIAA